MTFFAGICAPGCWAGMRPVPTWKSTAADPTPTRLGPSELPWPDVPWQLAQPTEYSFLPCSMARDWAESSAFASGAGASAAYTPPVAASAKSRTTNAASGWRRRAESFFTDYPECQDLWCRCLAVLRDRLLDQVDGGEEADPDDIDEVPVVGHDDRSGGLLVGEPLCRVRSPEDQQERDQTARHVQAVEAGGQIERRAVRVRTERDPVLLDQVRVLEDLTADEHRAHHEGHDEPRAQLLHVAALGGEDAHLAGERGEHQDRRVHRGERDVQCACVLRPEVGTRDRTEREVHREEGREEHQLGTQPDDGSDAGEVRPVDRRVRVPGFYCCCCRHVRHYVGRLSGAHSGGPLRCVKAPAAPASRVRSFPRTS